MEVPLAKDDQEDSYEKILSSGLLRAIDFIKFAETKNAALLTFCSAWMVAVIGLLSNARNIPADYETALYVSLPLFGIAALVCLYSFLPKLNISAFHSRAIRKENLLYFGDAASMTTDAFAAEVRRRYYAAEGRSATASYLDDLTVQLSVNSKIARRKFGLFNWSAAFALAAVTSIALVPQALSLWRYLMAGLQCH